MSRRQTWVVLGGSLLLGLWVAVAVIVRFGPADSPARAPDSEPLPVATETVTPQPFEAWRRYPGLVEAERDITLKSRVTGEVLSLPQRTGSPVSAGRLVVHIEAEAQRHERDRLQARLAGVDKEHALAVRQYERREALHREELLATEALDQARNRREVLAANRAETQAALAAIEETLRHARVEAPYGGTIGRVLVERGELVTPGTPLLELVDPSQLKVVFTLPSHVQAAIPIGTPVRIHHGERQWRARLDRRHPRLDGPGRGVAAEARLQGDAPPPPGQDVRVAVRLHAIDGALTVPSAALHDPDGEPYLFVIEDGQAHRRSVETGPEALGRTVVNRGLAPGERVITTPHPELAQGRPVRAER